MPDDTRSAAPSGPRTIRDVADSYVLALAELQPVLATRLGLDIAADQLPDLSPAGQDARDELDRRTLARLDEAERGGEPAGDERRCARLLRERLSSNLAESESGADLCDMSNVFGPVQAVRGSFLMMPAATEHDWANIAGRMGRVRQAVDGYRATLTEGLRRGLVAAPLQAQTFIGQLDQWAAATDGRGWAAGFVAGAASVPVSPPLQARLEAAAQDATAALAGLRDWLAGTYLPRTAGVRDGAGAERYRVGARSWTGADIDPAETYAWGWSQYLELREEMRRQAGLVRPGASAVEAMRHLDEHGEVVDGEEGIRQWLQQMTDTAVDDLDGTHFDLTARMRVVEARLAPAGSAAAPYYTPPSQDFSRPGRTWLPTLGRTRFPVWDLVSTWYHEGVPGHHLQYAQWTEVSSQLSMYQTSIGGVSACTEGWALYAERLMDELGYLSDPGARLGYLDAQMLRAMRVVADIGMHLELVIPADSPLAPGQRWTAALGREFFIMHSGRNEAFIDSEIVRYLSAPGQAISYKVGERAWLEGRRAARAARGSDFDLKAWHMAALSAGSLGLADLAEELALL
ncbi:MAG TPA: DUF885 domain-containing protein [Streptosporangiaceae bacterium]|jgi:uncharacterized protein (DUF885 family)